MKEVEYWRTAKGIFIKTKLNGTITESTTVFPNDEHVPEAFNDLSINYYKVILNDNDPLPVREAKSDTKVNLVLAADELVHIHKEETMKKTEISQEELDKVEEKKSDWVVSPNHYTQLKDELNGLECWDIYTILLRHKEHMAKHIAPLWANAFKYIWRVGDKPGDYGKTTEEKAIEDFEKVVAYCNKAIEELKKDIKK